MLAPEQKMRFFALVMITERVSGCSNRMRCNASCSSISTPRSYEFNFSLYPGRSPPSSATSIVKVATGPSNARRQCLYPEGSVSKSTPLIFIQVSFERGFLNRPVTGLSVKRKDFRKRHSRVLFNLAIRLDEGHRFIFRQLGPQRGLAGSAQTNQRNSLPPRLLPRTKIPHQPEHPLFHTVIGQAFEESLDHLLFGRLFTLRSE